MRETDDTYRTQLRDNMADPAEAQVFACQLCGHKFGVRAWPSADDGALHAFLDGLGQLAATTGATVYGLWMLVDRDADELPPPGNPDHPCQLWRANDRALLATTTMHEATVRTTAHGCRELN